MGMVAPWMAALGMAASSLLVVGNALRLSRSSIIRTPSDDSQKQHSSGIARLHPAYKPETREPNDMESLIILIPVALAMVVLGVRLFFWAVDNGQFDDLEGPAHSILFEDDPSEVKALPENSQDTPDKQPGD